MLFSAPSAEFLRVLCVESHKPSAFNRKRSRRIAAKNAKKSFDAIIEAVMYLTDGKNFNAEDAENGRGGRREKLWTAESRRTVGKLWTVVWKLLTAEKALNCSGESF